MDSVEPTGGWPVNIDPTSTKVWRAWDWVDLEYVDVTPMHIRDAWLDLVAGKPAKTVAVRWPVIADKLRRVGLARFDHATRQWVALRVPPEVKS